MNFRTACWVWLLLAAVGCSPTATTPANALRQVDPALLVKRGQLVFIRDSVVGRQVAERQGLPCLLFFTAEWCTYCHQMEETAFQQRQVGGLAEKFVCVLVDADQEPEVCREFGIEGYPTIQFLAADGRSLHRLVGRQPTSRLVAGMRAALERLAWLDDSDSQRR